jgi:hypothetical protein
MPRPGKKIVALADPKREARAAFVETFKAARGTHGDPLPLGAAVEKCRRADVAPWREMRNPLGFASDVTLDVAAKTVGAALPVVWREQMREMRDALGYETAPPLERPLIDHACLCWLRLALMELHYSALTDGNTFRAFEHAEKRLAAAQKRFSRAVELLARVRRLKLPAVQINVAAEGGQQINVA